MEDTATGLHPVMERALAPFAPPRDLASPQECEARQARLAAFRQQAQTRLSEMVEARRLRREHQIRTVHELATELAGLIASIDCTPGDDMSPWLDQLVKLENDLSEELMTPDPVDRTPEPRGEYDNWTVGVRNRGC